MGVKSGDIELEPVNCTTVKSKYEVTAVKNYIFLDDVLVVLLRKGKLGNSFFFFLIFIEYFFIKSVG